LCLDLDSKVATCPPDDAKKEIMMRPHLSTLKVIASSSSDQTTKRANRGEGSGSQALEEADEEAP
ncbi:hypothetical protein HAX54_025904, partial [Datura stramonium]|nr:hypothetical protein [Datura stramonium]